MDQDDPSPSLKRKTRPSDASTSGPKKKKGKAREGERPLKHHRRSESYDEAPLPFAKSPPPAIQHRRPTSDQVESLFVKDDGHPYTFFVQIEIRNRAKLADAIKVRHCHSSHFRALDEQSVSPEKRRQDSS